MISKKQIILTGGAASIVVALLLFPIGVIKQEEKKDNTVHVPEKDTAHGEAQSAMHTVELPPAQRQEVDKLKKGQQAAGPSSTAEKIGDVFASATAYDSAIYYYKKAAEHRDNLSIKIKTADAYYNLFGITEGQDAKVAKACKDILEEILTITPNNMEVKARLGYVTTLTSAAPMAGVGILNEVLEKEPNNRTALLNLGLLGIRSRQFDKAISRFERILSNDPDDQVARFYLAVCYKETDDLAKVRELVNTITASNSDPVLISESKKLLVE
ncbi:MAG TPA: tetratricopeptide repeat protein [Cytophagales bacterium]|nr:tetratricopeptide repeat protein [Cytophagales bacterium]